MCSTNVLCCKIDQVCIYTIVVTQCSLVPDDVAKVKLDS